MEFEQPIDTGQNPGQAALEKAVTKIIPYSRLHEVHREEVEVFEKEAGDRALTFIASHHSRDPKHPEFPRIAEAFRRFVEHRNEASHVFVEGLPRDAWEGIRQRVGSDQPEDYISAEGESAYTAALAEQAHIPWGTPEPDELKVVEAVLSKGYTPDELAAFYVFRGIHYTLDVKQEMPTYEEIGREILRAEMDVHMGWVTPMLTREEIRARFQDHIEEFQQWMKEVGREKADRLFETFKRLTGVDPRETLTASQDLDRVAIDAGKISGFTDPGDFEKHDSRLNQIAALVSTIRDQEIVRAIGKELAEGKNLFIVYGASHFFAQEPAIKELWDQLVVKGEQAS